MSRPCPDVRPLRINLLPGPDAHDYTAYADVLKDSRLLAGAVAVRVFESAAGRAGRRYPPGRLPGRRYGLPHRPGDLRCAGRPVRIPDVRIMESRRKWVVAWGESEPEPGWDVLRPDRLRFYGYAHTAVAGRAAAGD